ncbi:MAG: KEOPS complex subunit Cgi121 [Candidatus Hodarchaeota archaeon]
MEKITITGFENVKIENIETLFEELQKIEKTHSVTIQLFNSDLIATKQHLQISAYHALKAFKEKRNIAEKINMEIMLYASGQRQIGKAINLLGIKPENKQIAAIIITKENKNNKSKDLENVIKKLLQILKAKESPKVLEITEKKRNIICKKFDITEKMLKATIKERTEKAINNAITELILEKIALLALEKP